jgi:hypothetical protein
MDIAGPDKSMGAEGTAKARVVLAGSLGEYLEGGGYWWNRLQYLLGLRQLGHDVVWLDLLGSEGDPGQDRRRVDTLLARLAQFGLASTAIVLLHDSGSPDHVAESFTLFNATPERFRRIVRDADVLWNLCGAAKQPLLSMFKRRALIDLDPGVYQLSALTWDMGLSDHEVFFTVGTKMHDDDCEVPDLGVEWHPITPMVFLPRWSVAPDPGPDAPFTSITQWEWREMWLDGRILSRSKREAYLRYLDLPRETGLPCELAANFDPRDDTGDPELLRSHGWRLAHPHEQAGTPFAYRRYIEGSRAELLCPKPIYRDLNTGWLSDRSACYLATGRPVVCEDTGFSDRFPTGDGLLAFRDFDGAAAAMEDVHAHYPRHMAAARELATELFDSRRGLSAMLETSLSAGAREAQPAGPDLVASTGPALVGS